MYVNQSSIKLKQNIHNGVKNRKATILSLILCRVVNDATGGYKICCLLTLEKWKYGNYLDKYVFTTRSVVREKH